MDATVVDPRRVALSPLRRHKKERCACGGGLLIARRGGRGERSGTDDLRAKRRPLGSILCRTTRLL